MYFYFLVCIVSLKCVCNVILHTKVTEKILGNYESSNNSSKCLVLQTPSHVSHHTESKETVLTGIILAIIWLHNLLYYNLSENMLLGDFFLAMWLLCLCITIYWSMIFSEQQTSWLSMSIWKLITSLKGPYPTRLWHETQPWSVQVCDLSLVTGVQRNVWNFIWLKCGLRKNICFGIKTEIPEVNSNALIFRNCIKNKNKAKNKPINCI